MQEEKGGHGGPGDLAVLEHQNKGLTSHSPELKKIKKEKIPRVPGNLDTLFWYLLNKSARHHIFKYQMVSRTLTFPGSAWAPVLLLGGRFTSAHVPEISMDLAT